MCSGNDDGKKSGTFSARVSGDNDVEGVVVVASVGGWVCERRIAT